MSDNVNVLDELKNENGRVEDGLTAEGLSEAIAQEMADVENEKDYTMYLERLRSYGLVWTLRSVEYVLYKENISFSQLRSCVYKLGDEKVFNILKSTLVLIKAGLIGAKKLTEFDDNVLEDRAYEIVEDWRSNIGFIGLLHLLMIREMELKHFFIDNRDVRVLQHSASKKLQPDLVKNLLASDLEERIRQAQALEGRN